MNTIHQLIKQNRPNIAESSIKTYVFSLKKLGIIDEDDIYKIRNPNGLFDQIADMKVSQQRNLLSSVLIIIKAKELGDAIYDIYRAKCMELNEEYNVEQSIILRVKPKRKIGLKCLS